MPEMLVEHLVTVGYTRVDVVEMPGQVTVRGGILDVYSPEMERPVRIDFFGDEIESMRRFDPETQRSSSAVDEVLLLPLTETPATEELLGAINARLTQARNAERGGCGRAAGECGQRDDLSGVGVLCGGGWCEVELLELMGKQARVFVEEPAMVENQGERWWNKVEQRHERAGIGSLVRRGGSVSFAVGVGGPHSDVQRL